MYEPHDFDRRVHQAVKRALEDRVHDARYPDDHDVWAQLNDESIPIEDVRASLQRMGADWLDIRPSEQKGRFKIFRVERELPGS